MKRLGLLLLFIFGLLLIVYHSMIVEWLDEFFTTKDPRPVVAKFESTIGEVSFKKPKTLLYKPGKSQLSLRDQDTVVTGENGRAQISFISSGFQFEVEPNSVVIIEEPKADESGTLRITFLKGNFKVINQGTAGKVVIKKDNVFSDPAGRAPPPPVIVTEKPTSPPTPPAAPAPIKTEKLEEIKTPPPPKRVKKDLPKKEEKKRETLPDDYIASVVKKQTPFFNRCYTDYLRLNPNAKGRISLSFTIEPSGSVSSVRMLGSTIPDMKLQQCSMSVIERCQFRKFDGDPIIVNYPINFE